MKLKKFLLTVLVILAVLSGCGSSKSNIPDEIRAIWISYIDYTEILWGKTEDEYRNHLNEMMNNLKELKINTIYAHASAFSDAYYDSEIYPTAEYITGIIGAELNFDPFEILVDIAKENDMRVEAWINPYRSFSEEQMLEAPENCLQREWIRENNRAIIKFNQRWYLNPASEIAQETVLNVIEELIENYDIDGIHIDDYFYPEGIDENFDKLEYEKDGKGRTLSEFRKENVNELIKDISRAISKEDCTFSISPAGNIEYTTESIYGDAVYWVNQEWIDMIVPQIYFGFEHGALPYEECLKQWEEAVSGTDVKLVVGLAAYKINTKDNYAKDGSNEWINKDDILKRQIEVARQTKNYAGFALYSYHSIFRAEDKDVEKVSQEINRVIDLLME